MNPPYHIQLLNDLHQWFPEVLYNPQRFQGVQDLIRYIIQVASHNTYEYARSQYHTMQSTVPIMQSHMASRVPQAVVSQAPQAPQAHPVRQVSPLFPYENDSSNTVFVRTVQRPALFSSLSNTFISSILEHVFNGDDTSRVHNFLDDVVVIHPTDEQISTSTIVEAADTVQDDNCAICQDEIEEDQSMRIIKHCRHYFHKHCIDVWFQSNVTCPTCRYDIRAYDLQSDSRL